MSPFSYLWHRMTGEWDHRITAVIGGAATLNVSLDTLRNLLGLLVLIVGLVCSVRKELRETRHDRAHKR